MALHRAKIGMKVKVVRPSHGLLDREGVIKEILETGHLLVDFEQVHKWIETGAFGTLARQTHDCNGKLGLPTGYIFAARDLMIA